MGGWAQDLRFALRVFRTAPGFTIAALLTLALGIGANAAVFGVVDAVLLRPLPYAEPDRLVWVWPEAGFNGAMARRAEEELPALAAVTGVSGWEMTLTGEGEPLRIDGARVMASHFSVLGVEPMLGRGFLPEEQLPGRHDVVVLSHGLWTRVFGADPGVVGRRIALFAADEETHRVVGVMPPDFRPLEAEYEAWVPLAVDPALSVTDDDSWYVNMVVGRLAPGATREEAEAQLAGFARRLREEIPRRFGEVRESSVVPLHDALVRNVRDTLWIVLGAAGLVLLVACVNVANLLLARGKARERELAVRRALGAGRGRIARQLLTESLTLSLVGGALGLLVARLLLGGVTAAAPAELSRLAGIGVDARVFVFAFGASLLAALLAGAVPAIRSSRGTAGALRSGGRGALTGGDRGGASTLLVAGEMALVLVLAVAAGLMGRSLHSLRAVDPGFRAEGVLTLRLAPRSGVSVSGAERAELYRRILERIEALSGVESAGAIHLLPLTSANWNFFVYPEGREVPEGEAAPTANVRFVVGDYFRTLEIPLVRGRLLDATDRGDAAPVGVVNREFVRRHWPDENPIGREVRFSATGTPFTVVGVVGDVHQHELRREPRPEVYRPQAQFGALGVWLMVRTAGDPLDLVSAVKEAIWSVAPDVPLSDVAALDQVVARSAASTRFVTLLIGAFGLLALVLGVVGVYGVTAYVVGRRTPEYGIRVALGAGPERVLGGALLRGMAPVAVGIALGVAGALAATRLLASLLFGIEPTDPWTFGAVILVLGVAGLVATALPAWRASRVDPMVVLRNE